MKIYNTLTKNIEEFIPHNKDLVKIYTCGPTVYNYAHIGNLRTYIFEDILEKTLIFLGYKVERVMNITDVGHLESDADAGEDKMIKEASKTKKTVREIADFYTEAFFKDFEKLNIKKPEIISRASDNIDEYIKLIEALIDKGYAYINQNVYFDVSKMSNYYELSGKVKEDLNLVSAKGIEHDPLKKNQQDFALWFVASKFENQEMKWDSPFGYGYPGWHIECSGIAMKHLGEYLDFHCGGVDNIFPHHTNEIAQSEAYLGHKWCNYWVHGEHLNVKDGKMSKSSGNFLNVSLLEEKGYNPLSYRFMCLGSHYRNHLVFSFDQLEQAENTLNSLKSKVIKLGDDGEIDKEEVTKYIKLGQETIGHDLNTSGLITLVYDVLKSNNLNDNTKKAIIKKYDEVLSLDLLKEEVIDKDFIDYIEKKIKERDEYKKNKEYQEADQIRNELLEKGIKINDGRNKTTWEKIGG